MNTGTGTTTQTQGDSGTLPVTINAQIAFKSQDACGRGCLYNTDTAPAAVAININYHCTLNNCYCAPQSSQVYSSFMTSCWSYACYNLALGDPYSTIPPDISYALSIYNGYCATAYPQKAAVTTSASTSTSTPSTVTTNSLSGSSSSPSLPPSPVTASSPLVATTTIVTSTSAVAAASGLSSGAIGGIAGGVVGGLIVGILVAVIFFLSRRVRRKSRPTHDNDGKWSAEHPQQQTAHGRSYDKAELAAQSGQASQFAGMDKIVQVTEHTARPNELDNVAVSGRMGSPDSKRLATGPRDTGLMAPRAELEGNRFKN